MNRKDREHTQAADAPQTGPLPEATNKTVAKKPLPEVADRDARDPARNPASTGMKRPNLPAQDEQEADRKEVLEGVDRADSEQRRVAQSPTER